MMHIDHARLLMRISDGLSSGGESGVLMYLSHQSGDVFAMDVCEHFGLTPGRVANIVKRLVERGYVERRQVKDDLRKAQLYLTPSGAERAKALYADMTAEHQVYLDALGESDAAELIRILRRIISIADTRQ